MARRTFLAQLAGLPLLALGAKPQESKRPLKIMMKSAWGSDDPTRAAFPFAHGLVLAEAGHDVQIFLLAEATALLRKSMVNSVFPVGWPPLSETLAEVVARRIPIFSLRSLFPGPWGHGSRLGSVGSQIRQSGGLRFACRVGRPHYCRVKTSDTNGSA